MEKDFFSIVVPLAWPSVPDLRLFAGQEAQILTTKSLKTMSTAYPELRAIRTGDLPKSMKETKVSLIFKLLWGLNRNQGFRCSLGIIALFIELEVFGLAVGNQIFSIYVCEFSPECILDCPGCIPPLEEDPLSSGSSTSDDWCELECRSNLLSGTIVQTEDHQAQQRHHDPNPVLEEEPSIEPNPSSPLSDTVC
ncbi:Uncharacterized protein TCM_028671 [Theobroma cacao]|uniref:Uncharacterized protein n=1 Tax=Theobroma cacao TaxID=3641 RepID=A0A061GBD6_THECC|nr:Uncharacterized protein TCM_028671 [Theobroma cacao]